MFENFEEYSFPTIGLVRLPTVTIEDKYKEQLNLPKECSNFDFLKELAYVGFKNKKHKLASNNLIKYQERLDFELETFEELGFTDYVLLVWKVINKARELGGFIDFGRGSAAGSFTFALLDITGVLDVIEKGLYFERFVSRVRSKKQIIDGAVYLQGDLIADADLNLGGTRDQIVEWLNTEYPGRICKIAALGTYTGKVLIKDVYKAVNEVDEEEAKRVADLIEKHFGVVEDIEKMPEKNLLFKQWSERNKNTFDIALKLRDLIRQKSSHASGYFISFFPLDGFVPLELNKDKEVSISFEMSDACKFGTKLDLLGLTQNVILREIFSEIPEKLENIDLDNNPIIYNTLQGDFQPYGFYQISADTGFRVTKAVKPKNILELSDVNAIARPSALAFLKDYVDNTGKSPHQIFDKIFSKTRNLCLYQENIIQMIIALGFSADDGEIVRRTISKKKPEEIKIWEEKISKKLEERNLPKTLLPILFKILEDASKYSFNLCLSLDTVVDAQEDHKMMFEIKIGDKIKAYDIDNNIDIFVEVVNIYNNEVELYEIELESGYKIKCSMEHKFLCEDLKMYSLRDILIYNYKISHK